jgi:hypothetical protein
VLGSVVLGLARRGGLMSEVTMSAADSSEGFRDDCCELLRCCEEFIMTAIRDGVRTRVGVAGAVAPAVAQADPSTGVPV